MDFWAFDTLKFTAGIMSMYSDPTYSDMIGSIIYIISIESNNKRYGCIYA